MTAVITVPVECHSDGGGGGDGGGNGGGGGIAGEGDSEVWETMWVPEFVIMYSCVVNPSCATAAGGTLSATTACYHPSWLSRPRTA